MPLGRPRPRPSSPLPSQLQVFQTPRLGVPHPASHHLSGSLSTDTSHCRLPSACTDFQTPEPRALPPKWWPHPSPPARAFEARGTGPCPQPGGQLGPTAQGDGPAQGALCSGPTRQSASTPTNPRADRHTCAHPPTPHHPSIQAQPHPHPKPGAQVCFPEPTGCSTPTPTPRAGLGGSSLQGLSDPPAWQEWGAQAALPAGLVSAVGPEADLLPQAGLPQGRGLLEGLGAQTGQPRTDSGPLSRPTVEGKHGPCPRTPSSGPQVPCTVPGPA